MENASHRNKTKPPPRDQATAAAASLQLLLREDALLQQHGLTLQQPQQDAAFLYAAALLQQDDTSSSSSTQQRAVLALQEVERKLALVESLAVKVSRTKPEAVAGHLLRLHGYMAATDESTSHTTTSLAAVRDRTDRLERQAASSLSVAQRVESSLTRGLQRMELASTKLARVLQASKTLKMVARWQFEYSKLQTYDLEDVRDLTRAAASVAVLQLQDDDDDHQGIAVLEALKPQANATAAAVRHAAANLLLLLQSSSAGLSQLGATLQVYYHLNELPEAVYKAVNDARSQALTVSRQLWNPVTLVNLAEQAKKTAKDSRGIAKKLVQVRSEAAREWANGLEQAVEQVRNLERVLQRKTDPVQRKVYMDVVAAAPVPAEYASFAAGTKQFSLFGLFWGRLCRSLAEIIESVLQYEHGKLRPEAAGLYPAVRAVALELVERLLQPTLSSSFGNGLEETTMTAGIMGGSSALEDDFLQWTTTTTSSSDDHTANPQAAADAWTRPQGAAMLPKQMHSGTLAAALLSKEWKELRGKNQSGLYPLEQAFLSSCRERLQAPLQYMFPEHISLDEDHVPAPAMSLLPSKYDLQRFDENIRQELSLADPREGGGDLSLVTMIAESVVEMISDFILRAKNATSGVGEHGYISSADWSMTESLQHDRKVVAILYTLANYLRQAPEKTFVAPYRPANVPQHEEAASLCEAALAPAVDNICKMVKSVVLNPVCRAVNRQITAVLAKMHLGVYLESDNEEASPAFVQKHLAPVFDLINKNILTKFPPPYASMAASTIATYTIYSFVSNASLVRPLGEAARLHITQDLADLELTLDQFVRGTLSQLEGGRPYAELRAVRQMLFWSGLEIKSTTAPDVAKSLLREAWIKDVRPSTVFHYLFSYAPSLLSSPHHTKRLKAEEYVSTTLVLLDGSVEEDDSWMTTMACCDSYQQRAAAATITDGDARVAQILLSLGQELMRRRRR